MHRSAEHPNDDDRAKRFPLLNRLFASVDNRNTAKDATIVVKVVERGRFKVYIYVEEGGQHDLPHCHVRWSDGESVVELLDLAVLEGDALPRAARDLINEHYDDLKDVWNRLNPGRPIQ